MWKWLSYLPLKDLPLLKGFFPCYYDWLSHPDDGPFWDFANVEKKHNEMSVPAYNFTGWFDDGYGQPGAISNFLGMIKNGKTKAAREGQKLMIGPWTHLDIYYWKLTSKVGDIDFGSRGGDGSQRLGRSMVRLLDEGHCGTGSRMSPDKNICHGRQQMEVRTGMAVREDRVHPILFAQPGRGQFSKRRRLFEQTRSQSRKT